MTTIPTTRAEAVKTGSRKYLTGRPCRQGHNAPRYTTTGNCTACQKGVNSSLRATLRGDQQPVAFMLDPRDVPIVTELVEALALARSIQRAADLEADRRQIFGLP